MKKAKELIIDWKSKAIRMQHEITTLSNPEGIYALGREAQRLWDCATEIELILQEQQHTNKLRPQLPQATAIHVCKHCQKQIIADIMHDDEQSGIYE